ncbi:MAG: Flp pilus assembly protein CpaB [Terriglobales bacterium]|jgi:pilus assembly protein CpaB
MNRRRLLIIGGFALALGLLVSYAVYNQLRSLAGSNSSAAGVPVLVAANDIEVGAKLATKDVRILNLPAAAIPPGAFSNPAKVLNRGAILPMSKGEFILNSKLAALNAGAGLPSLIPPGMRAVSVRVNDVVSVAGFVQPGTRVDVMSTGNQGGGEPQTITVLQNVAVIAVGGSLLERLAIGESNAPVITLLVSPDDAQKLALASQEGRIQLALRNPLDTKKEGIYATHVSSLYPGAKPQAAEVKPKVHKMTAKVLAPANAPYQVEMIRGSKRDETKFQDK